MFVTHKHEKQPDFLKGKTIFCLLTIPFKNQHISRDHQNLRPISWLNKTWFCKKMLLASFVGFPLVKKVHSLDLNCVCRGLSEGSEKSWCRLDERFFPGGMLTLRISQSKCDSISTPYVHHLDHLDAAAWQWIDYQERIAVQVWHTKTGCLPTQVAPRCEGWSLARPIMTHWRTQEEYIFVCKPSNGSSNSFHVFCQTIGIPSNLFFAKLCLHLDKA